MPIATVNGIRLNYQETGSGEPVLLIMGSGSGGKAWHLHQVPALTAAGYRVITFDNRGTPPSDECGDGFTLGDLVTDTAELIEHLGIGPTRVVGTSMGAFVAQELALARPDLVRQAVLMATRDRTDRLRDALTKAEISLYDSGVQVPKNYAAVVKAMHYLSPRTLARDKDVADWLDLLELAPTGGPGARAQLEVKPSNDRAEAYRNITVPCRVISFADDLITPPEAGRRMADAIPNAEFELVPDCGHYGYLEDPDAVNNSILEFFAAED